MSPSPLVFYSVLELLAVFGLVSGILYWRLRKIRVRLDDAWQMLDETIEHQRYIVLRSNNKILIDNVISYLDALERLTADEPPGTLDSWRGLWQEVMRLLPEAMVLPVTDQENGRPKEVPPPLQDLENIDSLLDEQCQRITDLTDYKTDLVRLLRNKFEHVHNSNQELLSNVRGLMGKQSDVHGLLDVIAHLEASSENMQAILHELEQAKAQVEPQLEALARENQRLRAETNRNRAQTRDLLEEKQLWQGKSSELARKLEQRIQAYNLLYRRYEDLRRDYLNVFNQALDTKTVARAPAAEFSLSRKRR